MREAQFGRPKAMVAVVRTNLPNSMVLVELEGGRRLTAHLAREARATLTRLTPGDEVLVEASTEDSGECRIVGRAPQSRGR